MRKLDGRALFTYLTITMVGLALLALVSPSIGDAVPLQVVTYLVAFVPLLVIAGLLYYVFGSSNRKSKEFSHRTSQLLSAVASSSLVASVLATYVSTAGQYSLTRAQSVLENTGVAFLFVAFACTLLLINSQKFVYWPLWNSKDRRSADERQKSVRNRVYEKSYRTLLLVIFVLGELANTKSQRLHDELLQVFVLCL
ncbi:MAG TPA: hypothetical protein VG604_03985, partial [Candidatus Saccharimonadales bacterium]|nr:hypothetical protein [Candidatus Saccharimonadales bacterium]